MIYPLATRISSLEKPGRVTVTENIQAFRDRDNMLLNTYGEVMNSPDAIISTN